MQAIETHGLHTLSDPKKPTEVELQCIKEMFEASVDGQPYDAERFAQYYRPWSRSTPRILILKYVLLPGRASFNTARSTLTPADTPCPASD